MRWHCDWKNPHLEIYTTEDKNEWYLIQHDNMNIHTFLFLTGCMFFWWRFKCCCNCVNLERQTYMYYITNYSSEHSLSQNMLRIDKIWWNNSTTMTTISTIWLDHLDPVHMRYGESPTCKGPWKYLISDSLFYWILMSLTNIQLIFLKNSSFITLIEKTVT